MPNRVREHWAFDTADQLHELASGAYVPTRIQYTAMYPRTATRVVADIETTDNGPVCHSVRVFARDGVTTASLRQIPLGKIVRDALRRLEEYEPPGPLPRVLGTGSVVTEEMRADEAAHRPPGRRIDVDPADVARVYRKARELGQPPTLAVAGEFIVSRTTASRWIRSCREQGLLGPARPGCAGEFS